MNAAPHAHAGPTALLPTEDAVDAFLPVTDGASSIHDNASHASDTTPRGDAILGEEKTNDASTPVQDPQDGSTPVTAPEAVASLAFMAPQPLPHADLPDSLDSISTSITSSNRSSTSSDPSIPCQPVVTYIPSDGPQKVFGDTFPVCSVSSLSANSSATLAALNIKTASTPSARALETLRPTRAGVMLTPSDIGSIASLTLRPPSPAQSQAAQPSYGEQLSPIEALPQLPMPHSTAQHRLQHQRPSLKLPGLPPPPQLQSPQQQRQQQSYPPGAPDLPAELNPSLLFMVQILRHCCLSEAMCPVVVIGNTKAHAAAAWATLTASWGNSRSTSSTSSPGLTAAPTTNAPSVGCESTPGVPPPTMAPHSLVAPVVFTKSNCPPNNPHHSCQQQHNNNNNPINSNSPIMVSSNSVAPLTSTLSAQCVFRRTHTGPLLGGSITEYEGLDIDGEHMRARGVEKERQLGSELITGDATTVATLSSQLPPSTALFLDSTVSGITSTTPIPCLPQPSESATQLINPWPLIYANETALGLLGYHKLDDVIPKEFNDLFRCFVYATDNDDKTTEQQQQRSTDHSLNHNSTANNTSVPGITAARLAAPTAGRHFPPEPAAEPSGPLDELLRHTTTIEGRPPVAAAASAARGADSAIPALAMPPAPSKLREVHNLDELFAPRYDNYVFLYSERTGSYYAALAVSSDQIALPTTKETHAGPTKITPQRNPYLCLFDSFVKLKGASHAASHRTGVVTAPPSLGEASTPSQKHQRDPSLNDEAKSARTPTSTAALVHPHKSASQQQHSSFNYDLKAFAFPDKQATKASAQKLAPLDTAPLAGIANELLANHDPHARYLVLYILQCIETGQKPHVPPCPSVSKPNGVVRVVPPDAGLPPRRVTETLTTPLHPSSMGTVSPATGSKLLRPQFSSSIPILGASASDDADTPNLLPLHNECTLLQQQQRVPQQLSSTRQCDSDLFTTKLLHGVEMVDHTPLVELHCCAHRSSGDWNSSNANDSNFAHSDAALAAHPPVVEGPRRSNLSELSYTPFQVGFAKPARTSSDYTAEASTVATVVTAASTSSFNSRASTVSAAQSNTVDRHCRMSPSLHDFSVGDVTEQNIEAPRPRLVQVSCSLPLAPFANPFSSGSTQPSSAGSVPLNIGRTGSANLQQLRNTSSERSHSTQSDLLATLTTAQPSPTGLSVAVPRHSIQNVRNIEGVTQKVWGANQQQQQLAHERSSTGETASAAAPSVISVNPSFQQQHQQHPSLTSHIPVGATMWQRGGSRGLMGHSIATTATTKAPPSLLYSTHSSSNNMRQSCVPSRLTGNVESVGGHSASQLLGNTAAMTWQRSNEVDQIAAKKLADRIRSQRNVVSVAASPRLPETLIFNSIAFMIFVQKVLRFQERQGVSHVVCILNVRSKTQLVADIIPVNQLDDVCQSGSRSLEFTSSQTTPSTIGAAAAWVSSGSTAGATWTRTQPTGENLRTLVKRRLAKMDAFYSKEESRQTYPSHSDNTHSGHGSSTSVCVPLNELQNHDSSLLFRTATRAGSFVMSRSVDRLYKQNSSSFSFSEKRNSGEQLAPLPRGAAVPSAMPLRGGTEIGKAMKPPQAGQQMRRSNSHVGVNNCRNSRGYGVRCDARRSHSHEFKRRQESGGILLAGIGRRNSTAAQWVNRQPRSTFALSSSSAGGCQGRKAMKLMAKADAWVMGGSRKTSRSNSYTRRGTRSPLPSGVTFASSHPAATLHTSDISKASITTKATARATASAVEAINTAGTAAAVLADSMPPSQEPESREASLIIRNNSSMNNSNSHANSSKSSSSWSAHWASAQQLQSDSPSLRRISSLHHQQHQQQQSCYPPREWVPKSEYLSVDTQQNLSMCDGDINVSAHSYEAQVRIPFITPQRLELLSQLGNVQLSPYRGLSVFGVNLVNMVTEEAATAAAQPATPIIRLQYDIAARKYKKDAGEKSTVLPPFNGETAAKLDRLPGSGRRSKSGTTAQEDDDSAAAKNQGRKERPEKANLSPLLLLPPDRTARLRSPFVLPSPGRDAAFTKNYVSSIPSPSSPDNAASPTASAMEYTPHDEKDVGKSTSTSPRAESSHKLSSATKPDSNGKSVSIFAPDQQQHQQPSPLPESAREETPTALQQQQLRQQPNQPEQLPRALSMTRGTLLEKGSVVSVVMPSNGTTKAAIVQGDRQKRRPSMLSMAAAGENNNAQAEEEEEAVITGGINGDVEDSATVDVTLTRSPQATTSTKSTQASADRNSLHGFGRAGGTAGSVATVKKLTDPMTPRLLDPPISTMPAPPDANAAVLISSESRATITAKETEDMQVKSAAHNAGTSSFMENELLTVLPSQHRHHHLTLSKRSAGSSKSSSGAESPKDEQDAFFRVGLTRTGSRLMQTNECNTSLTLIAPTSMPTASLPADDISERSERSKSLQQYISMSPPPLLPHPVSVCERKVSPSTTHIDPQASPASTNSGKQGLVSVRTQKSGGTELLGYKLSNSAAAALGGFSTALVKEVTLDGDDDRSAMVENKTGTRNGCKEDGTTEEVNSMGNRTKGPAAVSGDSNPLQSPREMCSSPLDPQLYKDGPHPKHRSSMQLTAVAIALSGTPIRGSDSSISGSYSPQSPHPQSTANIRGDTSPTAATGGSPFTSTNTHLNVVATSANEKPQSVVATAVMAVPSDMPARPSSMAAAAGRHGRGNSMISFPLGTGAAFEDVRQVQAQRDEANDSFAESFMDIFGLSSHPQRLTELRRQVVDRMRDARLKSQSTLESSISSTSFKMPSARPVMASSPANVPSSNRVEVSNANSSTFHPNFSQPEVTTGNNTDNSSEKVSMNGPHVYSAGDASSSGYFHQRRGSNSSRVVSKGFEFEDGSRRDEETVNGLRHESHTMSEEEADMMMRHNLHVLVYTPRVYPEMEEVLGLYGHCTTFVTSPLKMLRYARSGLQPFDVLIVEWTDSLVNTEILNMLAQHAVNETVVVYYISTKHGAHTPTMNVENVMTDSTVVVHADDLLTGLLSRNVLEEVQQLIRRRRLLTSMVEIRMKQSYQIVSHIGSGAFGDVFEVLMYASHGKLAMKRIFLKSMKLRQLEVINREVCILSALEHPNIVSFSHTQLEDNAYSIFMELCDGTLAEHLLEPSAAIPGAEKRQQHDYDETRFSAPKGQPTSHESSKLGGVGGGNDAAGTDEQSPNSAENSLSGSSLTRPQDAVMIVHDIASALVYLHGRGIIHRDIKPANILFSNGMAKLGDFGSAVKMNESRKLRNMKGTMSYMAPEMVLGEPYTEACDLWSFGCLIASIMGIQLGHLSGLHMPALNELYRSIPINGSLPLTCSNRLSSKFENHYTEATTNRVLAALKRALANEMEERKHTPPPPVARTQQSDSSSPTASQANASVGLDEADDETPEQRHAASLESERVDIQNRQRSVMCISTTSIDVLGEFPAMLPASLVELFENLFHRDPAKRMTAADILDHPVSWDVEWMTRMMNEVQMIYAQLSLSTMSAHASMNANSCNRGVGAAGTTMAGSPLRGLVNSFGGGATNSESGNPNLEEHYSAGSGYGSSGYVSSPNAVAQPAGYVSYFSMQPGGSGAGEIGAMDLLSGGEARVNVPYSAIDYVLDLSLSGGSVGGNEEM